MLSRRNFLKGMIVTLVATAINKNGVLRPVEEIEQPTRTIFDMAANTWRDHTRIVGVWPYGPVVCFSAKNKELTFGRYVGSNVWLRGVKSPIGIVVAIGGTKEGESEYLVNLNGPPIGRVEFDGWRWARS